MTLRQLKWITVVVPLVFLALVDYIRRFLEPEVLQGLPGDILIGGVVLFSVLMFSDTVFGRIERMQARLERQNRELLALHQAGLDIATQLSMEPVLQKVVDHAAGLLRARYGAVSVRSSDGSGTEAFVTFGVSDAGQREVLAVPIVSGQRVLGELRLADKVDGSVFDRADEDTLARFATQAALAIENARLHRRVQDVAITEERERIAREMHDSLAQVLGYVNTKAQAVQELLKQDQVERAAQQVGQLGDAARAAYADVREGILGLRTSLGPQRGLLEALQEYVDVWREQSGVQAQILVDSDPPESEGRLSALAPTAELQLLRIVQEALANVRKHAAASHVIVRLVETPTSIEARVEDNGRGFAPGRTRDQVDAVDTTALPRFGLATMRERAESVGGSLEIASAPNHGTRVIARLPLRS